MQHVHIIGICGTFMAGLATLAKQMGYRVTGCDQNTYPPMSTLLESQGIALEEGFDVSQLALKPDLFIIGNVVSRGNPLVEAILRHRLPFQSGPQWLYEQVLRHRHVLAVSGTHGKTTTTAMLTHILQESGHDCGFLVGGVLESVQASAKLGQSKYFVIEADEYDTAFFDKQAKFLHYDPSTLIINNLEFDHADIYANVDAIIWQFHLLLRRMPDNARIITHQSEVMDRLLDLGCWSEQERLGSDWRWEQTLQLWHKGAMQGQLEWALPGEMNRMNALAAVAAANHIGIPVAQSLSALADFKHVKRRQELKGEVNGIKIYDDFAHHPTAIAATIEAFQSIRQKGRLWVLFDPASNSMKQGVHASALANSFKGSDFAIVFNRPDTAWDVQSLEQASIKVMGKTDALVEAVKRHAQPDDVVVCMSNGAFENIHARLLAALSVS